MFSKKDKSGFSRTSVNENTFYISPENGSPCREMVHIHEKLTPTMKVLNPYSANICVQKMVKSNNNAVVGLFKK